MPALTRRRGGRADYYRHGDFNRICDRSGFKVKASRTQKEWNGLIVRREDWEPRHPQDYVRGVRDQQSVREARPEPVADTFVDVPPAEDFFVVTRASANVITRDGDQVMNRQQSGSGLFAETAGVPTGTFGASSQL